MKDRRSAIVLTLLSAIGTGCTGSFTIPAMSVTASGTTTAATATVSADEAAPTVTVAVPHLEIQQNVIRLRRGTRIQFATNSDQILPASHEVLDEVVAVLRQNERLRIRVEGHTDNVGNDAENMSLSTRRAHSVQGYLVAHGIAADRLENTGCGEGVPLGDNATDDGRQQNRRVEFVILRRRRVVERCQVYRPRDATADATQPGGSGPPPAATAVHK
jgi:outer membrane protein OmpA-like peptidoglycan-associated protein